MAGERRPASTSSPGETGYHSAEESFHSDAPTSARQNKKAGPRRKARMSSKAFEERFHGDDDLQIDENDVSFNEEYFRRFHPDLAGTTAAEMNVRIQDDYGRLATTSTSRVAPPSPHVNTHKKMTKAQKRIEYTEVRQHKLVTKEYEDKFIHGKLGTGWGESSHSK
ncbi:hypothetical protein CBS101457_002910 [Exobasidium rhododendri]|nr:hypothetical protein CBS101457_002910 [Exobasidium rhododendri]